ncbi:MAG: zinc ABC transporter ATP-binding protein AztA [Tepidimonas sp.]|uniref:zinc ABC transporter ATP-binding protein AztA n=1 Tax=Tepidimonas sp. TaxID=2002775 RepID=UPI00298F3326|nr:zinc ABC transporter ATP-binding protein AztA [Tepidimonas sp.]MCS6811354.1 zinc ABC transporter ATP-binding protein AztA [Tepidimonas sp.]MCX7741675.1 zinc ABC transporter ATP-binding protein AztA [Tepidimonas sp.]MDW8335747.1 zinc ABC transporter ATP-binding protein AztA [Tepidimonas sp.]
MLAPSDITLHDLTAGYERHPAVHHVSLRWPAGSLAAVVGPNGAGKSTLLKCVAGRLRPMHGAVQGVQPAQVAYLPQISEVDRSFPLTVAELVGLGLWHELGPWRRPRFDQRARVAEAIAAVGLQGFERRTLETLSGGQFQRALFARLMLQDAPVVLLDEPFTGVDARTLEDLVCVLLRWHEQGRTVIAVLHDLALVRAVFPLTTLLARELVAHGPTDQVLTEAHLLRARRLQEAFDERAELCDWHDPHPEPAAPGADDGRRS